MKNQFLEAPLQFLRASLGSRLECRTTLEALGRMLEEIPVQAAYCPVCMDQFDAKAGEVAPPTVVRKRSCNHWCCDRCFRHCHDAGCSHDGCSDCMTSCEGHAESFCKDHIIDKVYCAECQPASLRRQRGRELAFVED